MQKALRFQVTSSSNSEQSHGSPRKPTPTSTAVAAVLVFVALTAVSSFISILRGSVSGEAGTSFQTGATVAWWLTAAVTMMVVAAVEELFFRAYVVFRLRNLGASPATAVVVSALLFALGHSYQGYSGLLFAFLAGLVLGWAWVFSRTSLTALAVGHGLYNLSVLLISSL